MDKELLIHALAVALTHRPGGITRADVVEVKLPPPAKAFVFDDHQLRRRGKGERKRNRKERWT